jgi:hypothetical protein
MYRRPADLPTSAPHDAGATLAPLPSKLACKPRLTDSGFATDHEHDPTLSQGRLHLVSDEA